jgi:1,4-alpha-glucan branching enzyme
MNDMLCYCSADPFFRKDMHDKITFSFMYAFSENFVLPLSHDEVVHGKKSLIDKMPGPYENKFAGLRALYGYMMGHPGKKMLFMGGEFAQFTEWNEAHELDWMLLDIDAHRQMQTYVKALNHFYLAHKELWENDTDWTGFSWISHEDNRNNVIAFRRMAKDGSELVCIVNFAPVHHESYRIGVPLSGSYEEVFTSDLPEFGGSGVKNGKLRTRKEKKTMHGFDQSIDIELPPLSVLFLQGKARAPRKTREQTQANVAVKQTRPRKPRKTTGKNTTEQLSVIRTRTKKIELDKKPSPTQTDSRVKKQRVE